jgi:hypothetical protein
MEKCMGWEYVGGLMELVTKESGDSVKRRVRGHLLTRTPRFIKVYSKMTFQTEED